MGQKSIRVASVVPTVAASSSPGSTRVLPKQQSSRVSAQRDAARCSSGTVKAAKQRHGPGTCSFQRGFLDRGGKICGSSPSLLDVRIRCGLTGACCSKFSCTGKHEPCRTMVTHTLSLSLSLGANRLSRALELGLGGGGVKRLSYHVAYLCFGGSEAA